MKYFTNALFTFGEFSFGHPIVNMKNWMWIFNKNSRGLFCKIYMI